MDNQTVTIEVDRTVMAVAQYLADEFPALHAKLEEQIIEAKRLLSQAERKLELAQRQATIIQGAEKMCALGGCKMVAVRCEVPGLLDKGLKDLRVLIKGISFKTTGSP